MAVDEQLVLDRLFPVAVLLPDLELVLHHEEAEAEVVDQHVQSLILFVEKFSNPSE